MDPELKKELSDIIERIAGTARKRHEIKKSRLELCDKMSVIRARHFYQIAMAKDEKDKPIYSNEQLREAQLVLMLDGDANYQQINQKLRQYDDDDGLLAIEQERLKDLKLLFMADVGIESPCNC